MKRIALINLAVALILISSFKANAQASFLNENFDVTCVTSPEPYSHEWTVYNSLTMSSSATAGNWMCTSTEGRGGTPGLMCSGVYGGSYHLDTSYLITPPLYMYGTISGRLFLNFDTKDDSVVLGGALRVYATIDTPFNLDRSVDLTSSVTPPFGAEDSSSWVTHQVNITRFNDTIDQFYITFRYTSTSTTGSTWFMDNVNTTPFALGVQTPIAEDNPLQLKVIGVGSPDLISVTYDVPIAGRYQLSVYDLLGREKTRQSIDASPGNATYPITGLDLTPGLYMIKMQGEGLVYAVAKAVVN